jgi:8-oxo-dGTP pyrophosphatase MutT (NUDIX family)
MRRSEGALALVLCTEGGRTCLLAQWNARWQALSLVGGHRRPGESFRDCLLREVAEELRLSPADFTAGDAPLARLEYVAWSEGAAAQTEYVLEVFAVELPGGAAARVSADPANAWLTAGEVRAGRSEDGRRVSPTLSRVLAGLPRAALGEFATETEVP